MGLFSFFIGGYVKNKAEEVRQAVDATFGAPPKDEDEPVVRRPRESKYSVLNVRARREEKAQWDAVDRIRRENEARKQKISPETKKSIEQMAYERKVIEGFQQELTARCKKLDADIQELKYSMFSCFFDQKRAVKKIKYSRLHMLAEAKVTDLLSFKEKARAAMLDKDVIRGFTSKSKKLLQRIIDAPMTELQEQILKLKR